MLINKYAGNKEFMQVIASVFPDIVSTFGKYNKGELLRPAFLSILMSDAECKHIVVYLPEILSHLIRKNSSKEDIEEDKYQEEDKKFDETVMRRIKDLWAVAETGPWRTLVIYIELIPKLHYSAITEFNIHYLEAIWTVFTNANSEVKRAAIKSMCRLLVCNTSSTTRKNALKKLMGLSCASSFYERREFITFCTTATEIFAFSLINTLELLKSYLQLSVDRVPNIRLSFAKSAVKMWTYGIDESFRKDLLAALNSLQTDKNAEVRKVAEKAYNFITEHYDEIIKGDTLRLKQNESKESKERELEQRQSEEEKELGFKVFGIEKKYGINAALKKNQERQIKKRLSNTILTNPKSNIKGSKKTSRAGKESSIKVYNIENPKSSLKIKNKAVSPINKGIKKTGKKKK
eukprot:TRINITY_DN9217_c0_g2_i1.p1 TRINITY_DN9217_c0_g2~~TRINITY_DN9217_c0_g2_i1.p1  ORF type:complete len:405 (-),score=91.91 TRINITY_DN9217_c0_g2_i1:149-1363(-)